MKLAKLILILIILLLPIGCTNMDRLPSNEEQQIEQDMYQEPIISSTPLPKPTHVPQYVEYDPFQTAYITYRAYGDLDNDGFDDKAIVWCQKAFQVPFNIEVILSTGDWIRGICDLNCLDLLGEPYILDITGDGKAEIVIPMSGGTDTQGEIESLLIQLKDGELICSSIFQQLFFPDKRAVCFLNYRKSLSWEDPYVELVSHPAKNTYKIYCLDQLERIDWDGDVYNLEIAAYVIAYHAKIVEFDDGTTGLKIHSSIKLCFNRNDRIGDTPESLIFYMHSYIGYNDGEWKVVKEELFEGNEGMIRD